MRLVFAGTPGLALPALERLATEHEVIAVLTRPAAPQGRSARLIESPVAQWAEARGIEVLAPTTPRDPALTARLRRLAPDCCPVVAYGGLITTGLLAVPELGWINLHFSLLPRWRGAAPVQRALLAGDTSTGVTTFRLVRELDAGPVFGQIPVPIESDETAGDLLARLADLGAEALAAALAAAARGTAPTPQPSVGVTLAPKLRPDEARLDLTADARAVLGRVRAMSPEPGAWAHLGSQRFKVLRARLATSDPSFGVDGRAATAPGDLWATKHALYVRVGDAALELTDVQAAGKPVMPGAAWARGALRGGARLA